ncbi:MAG: murein biosynthesis integral membrane protein MurJ [Alphaproteobacteria bacterium]|nr:murein biosynthesis integral membrane protein MurJ [Alphaproteobacteria bacterium]
MASRVLGFLRDILIARLLGASMVSDVFFVALQLPNVFRRLFAEGAFNAAFVPLFAGELTNNGRSAAKEFAEKVLGILLVFLILLTVLIEIFMPSVITLIAGGFTDNPRKFWLAVDCARLTFPYLMFISISALLGGILNTLERFMATAAAPIALNLLLIGALFGIMYGWFPDPGTALSSAVLLAGIGQLIWLSIICFRTGLFPAIPKLVIDQKVKRFFLLIGPGVIGAGVYQINVLIGIRLATELPEGSVSFLYFADRITQLPLGVVGAAVGVALLPLLSRQLKAGDAEGARKSQSSAIELSMLLTLPATAALLVLSTPIITILFQRGEFGAEASAATAVALKAFTLGLPAYVLIKALSPAFFAREDTVTPVKVAVIALITNVVFALLLMPYIAHVGIALATAVSAWINALILILILIRRDLLIIEKALCRNIVKIILVSGITAVVLWALSDYFSYFLISNSFLGIVTLILLIVFGLTLFTGLVHITGIMTWKDLKDYLRRD